MNTLTFSLPNGEPVSRLGQGTYGLPPNSSDALTTLRAGLDIGLNLIDTAEMYGTEPLVGKAIADCRDRVFVVSKVLPENASYEGTIRACEASLSRLNTDYLDLYLLHWLGPHPLEETVRALVDLKAAGKIRHWGMSNLDVDKMEDVLSFPGGADCATDQVLYNLRDRGVEFDLIPWCAAHQMPVMAYTPLGSERTVLRHDAAVRRVARERGIAPTQVLLAWVMRHPNVVAIPKAGSVAHVQENAQSLQITLTPQELSILDESFPAPKRKIPLAGW